MPTLKFIEQMCLLLCIGPSSGHGEKEWEGALVHGCWRPVAEAYCGNQHHDDDEEELEVQDEEAFEILELLLLQVRRGRGGREEALVLISTNATMLCMPRFHGARLP